MDVNDFQDTFFEEAQELLADFERQLLAIVPAAPCSDALDAVFRAIHSIKGGAATFGFDALKTTAHALEEHLDSLRQAPDTLTPAHIDRLLEAGDRLADMLQAYRDQDTPDVFDMHALLTDAASAPTTAPAAPTANVWQVTVDAIDQTTADALIEEISLFGTVDTPVFADERLFLTLESDSAIDDIRAVLGFVVDADRITFEPRPAEATNGAEFLDALADTPAATQEPTESAEPATPSAPRRRGGDDTSAGSLRVATDKIDHIINLVGELVITQAMLGDGDDHPGAGDTGHMASGLAALGRHIRDLQQAVLSIRMMPMTVVFDRFPRLVRELSHKLDKQVRLSTDGGATELDKGMVERIVDPLTHLVRNSLDHGIEDPATREASGKPAEGHLALSARHEGGHVVIEIADDGAGLSRDRILAKAREKGLVVDADMPDDAVWELIFAPGFSTAAAVSDVSGRGVGMDVVRRNIAQLGGSVTLASKPGAGTTVTVILPLTLAIMDAMIVRVGPSLYVLPLSAVLESIQIDPAALRRTGRDRQVIVLRENYLPVVQLDEVFDEPDAGAAGHRPIAVIVSGPRGDFALPVDELVGQQQVVVKNIETHFRAVPGISAATILGNGQVALILDTAQLMAQASRPARVAVASSASEICV